MAEQTMSLRKASRLAIAVLALLGWSCAHAGSARAAGRIAYDGPGHSQRAFGTIWVADATGGHGRRLGIGEKPLMSASIRSM
jgi:hypothetical protein